MKNPTDTYEFSYYVCRVLFDINVNFVENLFQVKF